MRGWGRSDPDIVLRGQLPARITGIDHAAWLDDKRMAFLGRTGNVLDPPGYDKHFTLGNRHFVIAKADLHLSMDNKKDFVGVIVLVPDKITLQLDQFELDVVHLGDYAR